MKKYNDIEDDEEINNDKILSEELNNKLMNIRSFNYQNRLQPPPVQVSKPNIQPPRIPQLQMIRRRRGCGRPGCSCGLIPQYNDIEYPH